MNNEEIINPYEGQSVDNIVLPFYRYSALLPKQLGGDLFVWLYLSLVVFTNEGKNLVKDSYTDDVKQTVQKILIDKFGNVIDSQTFEKIVSNAERDFVDGGVLKENTFTFLDTYEDLFSDKLDVKYVYQDAITGEVVPFFGDTSYLEDVKEKGVIAREGIKEPSKKAVKKAYEQYAKIKKFSSNYETVEVELEDEYEDADEQTFLDDSEFDQVVETFEKKELKNLRDYNVIFLKDKKTLFNLESNVFVENNQLVYKSPFGDNTNQWINKCIKKGRNVSELLNERISEIEKTYLIEEKRISEYVESHKSDFASHLQYVQTLYRMIDSLNDNTLRKYVVELDQHLINHYAKGFYQTCGLFLERMLKMINYTNKSNSDQRRNTSYEMFCREIEDKFYLKNIKYEFLKSRTIYSDWMKKYLKKDGSEYSAFKADITDILLRTNLIDSKLMYPSFIDEIFNMYSKRNDYAHDHDPNIDFMIDTSDSEKLTKILKVLFELI